MNRPLLFAVLLLAGCASGPRAVPTSTTPEARLALAEDVLQTARNVSASFEIESKGENAAKLAGTLRLFDGNALHLQGEGSFKGEGVQLLVDSRDPDGINRSTTRGPSVSSHRDPPASKLREAVALGLVRMGLLHNLAKLSLDQPIEKADGGFGDWVKAVAIKDGHSDNVHEESCRRVDFDIEVSGKVMGDASVCVSDVTGLVLHRRQTVHFATGDMTVSETFKWEVK
ncbi:MAG: hypothetical protein ACOZQL_00420 [Myxococcota bacterium]